MIILFIPIMPFVNKVASFSQEYIPVVGPFYKYTKRAIKVTEIANPVTAVSRATGYLVMACSGPIIKYPALCAIWAGSSIIGWSTGNPIFISISFEFASMILEEGGGKL
jgi:hypothetical protein